MSKLKVKGVFFDFDDTLQSRKGAYRLYCEDFLSKYFPNISEEERLQKLDEMEEHVDGGYKDREVYFPEMIALWNWQNHPPMQELYDSFNIDFGKHVVMLPGAIEVLKEIKKRGYILGAITNGVSSLQNIKLDTAGIRELFDVVVVSGDIGIYKPDRRIFDEAVRRAGIRNEEALFVGDHPINDIEGALGADMQVIRMNYGDFKGKGLGKQGVAAEIEDIRQVLDYV
ncbi:MAG: HAD family hydrolase [Acutalibacteraceae bacterium]